MATNFTMPSMFDTRYAMDRQMELDAQKAGQVGGRGKRYGMYYNSSLLGDRDNATLMSLTGMMGGQGDPRMQKQMAIDSIMQQYPNPETAEDFKAISNALRQVGLYEEADRSMSMANEIISSTPERTIKEDVNGIKRYVDTGEQVFPNVTKTQPAVKVEYKEIKTINAKGEPVTNTHVLNADGSLGEVIASTPSYKPEEAKERKITKAADGYHYYVDDGTRVFPGVEKIDTESSLEEKIRIWKESSEEERKALVDSGIFGANVTSIQIDNFGDEYTKAIAPILTKQDNDLVNSVDLALSSIEKTNKILTTLNEQDESGDFVVTTGLGAEVTTNINRGWNLIKSALGFEPSQWEEVSKEQYLEALLGSDVFPLIKQLGIGARGLDTPAEREFLLSVMTGKRTMDRGALQRITKLRQDISREIIDKYNEQLESGALDQFQTSSKRTLKPVIAPEMVKINYVRPKDAEHLTYNGVETGFFTWGGQYYNNENDLLTIEEVKEILNNRGFFDQFEGNN